MPCTLIVAEKPSVARDIARVLGCKQRGEGCLAGGRLPDGGECRVTWAIGHLVSLMEPEELDPRYKKWNAADLPILPAEMKLKVLPKTKAQFAVIRTLLRSRDVADVVCATDAGREGELIFRYIYEMAGCAKPVRRLWISSMTDEAIREGFARLKPASEYDALYQSARCRSQADWLVGMNASRAFTLRYGALLSIGRVQTPTLEMLVRRRAEIESFEAKPYWLVQADFGDYTGLWFDPANKDARAAHRILEEAAAQAAAARVRGRPARVERATREEKRDLPPQLFDLTSLQREANQKLGFTAQRTLSVAQSLYEKFKLITYPRTDSRHLPKDMLQKTRQALAALGEPYAPWTEPLLAGKLPMPSRVFDDAKVSDHHAILPTPKRADTDALPADEGRLYALIARRAVAAFLPPCVYDALRVVTAVDREGSNQEGLEPDLFLSTGRVERDAGWKALYRALEPEKAGKKQSPEEQEQALPALATGDGRTVETATVKQEATKPPAPHTDASLLYAMEHAGREVEDAGVREQMKGHGLGTPATRAAILERLIAVGYAQRRGKQLWATDKGVRLIGVAPADIASPETTGRWEKGLDDIERRAASPERFLDGIRRLCASLVRYAADQAPAAAFEAEARSGPKGKSAPRKKAAPRTLDAKCPLCGEGSLSENSKAFGCSRWKQGCAFTLWKNAVQREGGPALTEALVRALLQSGSLRGSTGTLYWRDNRVSFEPAAALKLKNPNKS
ncbi:MAG: DNA topoisomerase 3 [Clostridia bacterium]|nr:DNA topoisomerase 3 [Clostridia bacterium]